MHALTASASSDSQLTRAIPNVVVYDSETGKPVSQRVYAGNGIPISIRDGSVTLLNSKGVYFSIGHSTFN